MNPIRKIPKKVTKKFIKKVINRQCFHRKTGLKIKGIPDTFSYSYKLNEYAVLEGGAIITSLDLI